MIRTSLAASSALPLLAALLLPAACTSSPPSTDAVLVVAVDQDVVSGVGFLYEAPRGTAYAAQPAAGGNLQITVRNAAGDVIADAYRTLSAVEIVERLDPDGHVVATELPIDEWTELVAVPMTADSFFRVHTRYVLASGGASEADFEVNLNGGDVAAHIHPLDDPSGDVGARRAATSHELGYCENVSYGGCTLFGGECPDPRLRCEGRGFLRPGSCVPDDYCPPRPGWPAQLEHLVGSGPRAIVLMPWGSVTLDEYGYVDQLVSFWPSSTAFVDYARHQAELTMMTDWFARRADEFSFYAFTGVCRDSQDDDHLYGNDVGICSLGNTPNLRSVFKLGVLDFAEGCGGVTSPMSNTVGMGNCGTDDQWVLAHELGHAIGGLTDEYDRVTDPVCGSADIRAPNVGPREQAPWMCEYEASEYAGESCPDGEPPGGYPGVYGCGDRNTPCTRTIMRLAHTLPEFGPVSSLALDHALQTGEMKVWNCPECTDHLADGECGLNSCGAYEDHCAATGERCERGLSFGPIPDWTCSEDCGGPSCMSPLGMEVCAGEQYLIYDPGCGSYGLSFATCDARTQNSNVRCFDPCPAGSMTCPGTNLCTGAAPAYEYDVTCNGMRLTTCNMDGSVTRGDCACAGSSLAPGSEGYEHDPSCPGAGGGYRYRRCAADGTLTQDPCVSECEGELLPGESTCVADSACAGGYRLRTCTASGNTDSGCYAAQGACAADTDCGALSMGDCFAEAGRCEWQGCANTCVPRGTGHLTVCPWVEGACGTFANSMDCAAMGAGTCEWQSCVDNWTGRCVPSGTNACNICFNELGDTCRP
ncbi:MAG: hypothetical protein IT378_00430 [Sandaracinaceae bacterium]|nr:hypothetical protein [Sandaracinaceae bacterium]